MADCIAGEEDKHAKNTKKSSVVVEVTGKQLVCGSREHSKPGEKDIHERHLGSAVVVYTSVDDAHWGSIKLKFIEN
jgi:hypothetical protein